MPCAVKTQAADTKAITVQDDVVKQTYPNR